jgi:hypothetical protein
MAVRARRKRRKQRVQRTLATKPRSSTPIAQELVEEHQSPVLEKRFAPPGPGETMSPGMVLQLQRTIGNRAVTRLVQERQNHGTLPESEDRDQNQVSLTVQRTAISQSRGGVPDIQRIGGFFKKLFGGKKKPLTAEESERNTMTALVKQVLDTFSQKSEDITKGIADITSMIDANIALNQTFRTELAAVFPAQGNSTSVYMQIGSQWKRKLGLFNLKKNAFDTAIRQADNSSANTLLFNMQDILRDVEQFKADKVDPAVTKYKSNNTALMDHLSGILNLEFEQLRDAIKDQITEAQHKVDRQKIDPQIKGMVDDATNKVGGSRDKTIRKRKGLVSKRVDAYFQEYNKKLKEQQDAFNQKKQELMSALQSQKFTEAKTALDAIKQIKTKVNDLKTQIPNRQKAKDDVALEIAAGKGGLKSKIGAMTWKEMRSSISDAAVKLGDKRDEAQKYYAYQMLDLQTINYHIKDTEQVITDAKPRRSNVALPAMFGHLKNHALSKQFLGGNDPTVRDIKGMLGSTFRRYWRIRIPRRPRRGQPQRPLLKTYPQLLTPFIRLVLLYRARVGAAGSLSGIGGVPVLPADFTGGYEGLIPKDKGRVGRAQWLYQTAFDQYEDALKLYDTYETKSQSRTSGKPDAGEVTKVGKFWDHVNFLHADVRSLKTVDKQKVKEESAKYNKKIGTRQMSKGKRVAKKIFAPLLSVGYGLISGGRKSVKAETGPAGYRTDFKVEDKADKIAESVKEIGMIWGNVGDMGAGLGHKGMAGRIVFGIFKVVRLIVDILAGIFGNIGMLAALGGLISTPLAASGYGASVPGIFAAISTGVLIGSLACTAAKGVIDLILLAWSGIAKAGARDPRSRRNLRKVVKSTGMDLAGDVGEGIITTGGALISAGIGSGISGDSYGKALGETFAPNLAYSAGINPEIGKLTGTMTGMGLGSGVVDPTMGLIQEGTGTALDAGKESETDVPDQDVTKPLEKSGGLITWIIKKLKGVEHVGGKGGKVARAIDRIIKRVVMLAVDIIGALTLLPALLYDIIKGIIVGVKSYREAKQSAQTQKTQSTTRPRVNI